jgi:hypothetical protein
VSPILRRQAPSDHETICNNTGVITIPPQGNYIVRFTDGSPAATWGFWPEGSAEKVGATAGGTLADICGHTGYEYVRYYCYEAQKCDLCGKVLDVIEVEPDIDSACFSDVQDPGRYYMKHVYWAAAWGIASGTGSGKFSPDNPCTRAHIVTFLWAAAGKPEPKTTENPFSDVPENAWYTKAVLWAVENKVASGTGNGLFSPMKECNRATVVTFMWAAAGKPEPKTTENPFTDVPDNAWYTKAVLWAVENKITSGTGGGKFSPMKTCTRGQIVTFLHAFENLQNP